jgi:hypothetical protein
MFPFPRSLVHYDTGMEIGHGSRRKHSFRKSPQPELRRDRPIRESDLLNKMCALQGGGRDKNGPGIPGVSSSNAPLRPRPTLVAGFRDSRRGEAPRRRHAGRHAGARSQALSVERPGGKPPPRLAGGGRGADEGLRPTAFRGDAVRLDFFRPRKRKKAATLRKSPAMLEETAATLRKSRATSTRARRGRHLPLSLRSRRAGSPGRRACYEAKRLGRNRVVMAA